jgi:hypothetical protein
MYFDLRMCWLLERWPLNKRIARQANSPFFEIASVLVRSIALPAHSNANHSVPVKRNLLTHKTCAQSEPDITSGIAARHAARYL